MLTLSYIKNRILILFIGAYQLMISQHTDIKTADSLYQVGNYAEAIQQYQKITPRDQYIYVQLAKSHKAKGTYADALTYYKIAIGNNPSLVATTLEYGKLLMTTKKRTLADSVFSALVTTYPDNPNFLYQSGLVKEQLKDTTSIQYFKQAFALDTTHQKSCYKIAKYYLKKRNYDLVTKYANTGLQSYSENTKLISILGQNYFLRQFYNEAIPYFEKLMTLHQENEFVHSRLAICYSNTDQYQKAITHFEKALEYNDKVPLRYSRLAKVYLHLKKYDKALENFNIALTLKDLPTDKELLSIAMVHRHQEQWKKAMNYAKRALKENPDYETAQYQLATFADAYYKDPNKKLEYYNQYLKKFGKLKTTIFLL